MLKVLKLLIEEEDDSVRQWLPLKIMAQQDKDLVVAAEGPKVAAVPLAKRLKGIVLVRDLVDVKQPCRQASLIRMTEMYYEEVFF